MKITRDVPKSITKCLIPPHRNLISEQYLTPWSGDVELAQSFCAKGDGATGYITFPNASISGVAGSDWSIAVLLDSPTQLAYELIFGSSDTTAATERFYFWSRSGKPALQIGSGGSANIRSTAFPVDTQYLIMLQYSNSTGKITIKIKNMVTEVVEDGIEYTVLGLAQMNDDLFSILSNNGSYPSPACVANFRLWFSSISFENMQNLYYGAGANLNVDFNGSVLDKSGNDYHGTVVGAVDLYERQDSFHSNIVNGFDLWFRTGGTIGTESDYVWVPHVDGVGVVDAVAGFTLQSSHPKVAFKNDNPLWHNGAETALRFPAGSLMDKSVVADWLVAIQATLGYDGANPTDWYCNSAVPTLQEVTPYFLSTYWDDASNKIGVATTPNEYTYDAKGTPITGDITEELVTQDLAVTKSQSLIIYSQAMIVRQLDKFGRYVKRLVGI